VDFLHQFSSSLCRKRTGTPRYPHFLDRDWKKRSRFSAKHPASRENANAFDSRRYRLADLPFPVKTFEALIRRMVGSASCSGQLPARAMPQSRFGAQGGEDAPNEALTAGSVVVCGEAAGIATTTRLRRR
jgi:hypothetical protein